MPRLTFQARFEIFSFILWWLLCSERLTQQLSVGKKLGKKGQMTRKRQEEKHLTKTQREQWHKKRHENTPHFQWLSYHVIRVFLCLLRFTDDLLLLFLPTQHQRLESHPKKAICLSWFYAVCLSKMSLLWNKTDYFYFLGKEDEKTGHTRDERGGCPGDRLLKTWVRGLDMRSED